VFTSLVDGLLDALASVEQHYTDFVSEEEGIINFEKFQKTADIVHKTHPRYRYNIVEIDIIQTLIEQSLASVDPKADYWATSMDIEPPKREKEKKGLVQSDVSGALMIGWRRAE
jgi:hypothetical protein